MQTKRIQFIIECDGSLDFRRWPSSLMSPLNTGLMVSYLYTQILVVGDALTTTGLEFSSTSPSLSSSLLIITKGKPSFPQLQTWICSFRFLLELKRKRALLAKVIRYDSVNMQTRDLLGGSLQTEIDLEIGLPPPLLSLSGWERRLDMKSGKVYYGTTNPPDSVQDLNFPPTSIVDGREKERDREKEKERDSDRESLEEHDFMGGGNGDGDGNVEAHLLPIDDSDWQSVCTLDKVKMALQRAHKQTAKRKGGGGGEEALQCYTSSSSFSEAKASMEYSSASASASSSLLAAGCPRCLLYVLLPKSDPKCPRCSCSILDVTTTSVKRPRLYPTDTIANQGSNNASPPFLFDLNTPI